jgi:hypothetical protein
MAQRAVVHRIEIAHPIEIGARLDIAQSRGIETDLLVHADGGHKRRNGGRHSEREHKGQRKFLQVAIAVNGCEQHRNGKDRPPDHGIAIAETRGQGRAFIDKQHVGPPVEPQYAVKRKQSPIAIANAADRMPSTPQLNLKRSQAVLTSSSHALARAMGQQSVAAQLKSAEQEWLTKGQTRHPK